MELLEAGWQLGELVGGEEGWLCEQVEDVRGLAAGVVGLRGEDAGVLEDLEGAHLVVSFGAFAAPAPGYRVPVAVGSYVGDEVDGGPAGIGMAVAEGDQGLPAREGGQSVEC